MFDKSTRSKQVCQLLLSLIVAPWMASIIAVYDSINTEPSTTICGNASDEDCKPIKITPRCSFTCNINTERPTNATCKSWLNAIDPSDNKRPLFFLNIWALIIDFCKCGRDPRLSKGVPDKNLGGGRFTGWTWCGEGVIASTIRVALSDGWPAASSCERPAGLSGTAALPLRPHSHTRGPRRNGGSARKATLPPGCNGGNRRGQTLA